MTILATWIFSGLLVLPTVLIDNTLVNFEKCSLVTENYGMTLYVAVMTFFLPACILTPMFIKWSNLTHRFAIQRDISCDFLDNIDDAEYGDFDDDPVEEQEPEVMDSRSWSYIDADGESHSVDVQCLEKDPDQNSLHRKASRATMLFLKIDANMERTLFTLALVNGLAWLPFFSLLILEPLLSGLATRTINLAFVWLGFAQSPLTPALIYMLSDRVHMIIHGTMSSVWTSSVKPRQERRRTRTITFNT